ncbi:hypothetical protein [Novosphingobium pituita]|uniref:Uncharacterized protein n=1 Tax=Novosphingobium pituita TaxID=3056842 RepID=A0ABQ6P4P1_9SPHN|nr:hypothetical protein [Novosphingobium sp. IK01]GMM59827.1 hypothetical protein NUTIK01_06040 [Novosphingobium sp. IK01]
MTSIADLIPELSLWNNGAGISPDGWIFSEGRADHALGFCSFLWPNFEVFGDYVLRAPVDVERLRGWEKVSDISRGDIETAMNAYLLDDVFPQDQTNGELKQAQCERLAGIMAEMLAAKLAREFPDRRFSAFAMGGDDFGVSFHQV